MTHLASWIYALTNMKKKLLFLFIAILVIHTCFTFAGSNDLTPYKTARAEVNRTSTPATSTENAGSVITIKYLEGQGWFVIRQEGYDASDNKTYPAGYIQELQPWLEAQLGPSYNVTVEEISAFTTAHLAELTDNYSRLQADYAVLASKPPVVKEVPVEVEKVVTVTENITPRYFTSEAEARGWIANHHLPDVLIADANGRISFNNSQPDARYDCDDYARDYVQLALQDGFLLYEVPVVSGTIWHVQVTNPGPNHVGVMARIQNTYYYIETSPGPYQWRMVKILNAD